MLDQRPTTRIAAHRGGAGLWPENSLTAFRGALRLEVEQIETDIHLSADGEPFILHDAKLDRTTEATGVAGALTWAALSRIRLKRTEADTIPHLDDLLTLIAPSPLELRLELKPNAADEADPALFPRALASLERFGMTARTIFTSFEPPYLAQVRAAGFGDRMLWLIDRPVLDQDGLEGVLGSAIAAGVPEIALHISQSTAAHAAETVRRGLRYGCYAVNDTPAIEKAFAHGAVVFTTDRPDLAIEARKALSPNRR